MPLPSGVYIIKNIGYHNWVTLPNENDTCDLVAGSNIDTNVSLVIAEMVWSNPYLLDARLNSPISWQWRVTELDNGTYDIQNHYYNRHHVNHTLGDDSGYVTSVRDKKSAAQWRIDLESNDRYKYGAKR